MLPLAPIIALLPFTDAGHNEQSRAWAQAAVRSLVADELVDAQLAPIPSQPGKPQETEPAKAARIARELKADWVVMGAFDVNAEKFKLWAQLYSPKGKMVATGSAVVSAVELPDGVHQAVLGLLRSMTPPPLNLIELTMEKRPPLRSARAGELFGEALVSTNDEEKRRLLQMAMSEDPTFGAVMRALEELDAHRADAAQSQLLADAAARLKELKAKEKDPTKLAEQLLERFGELHHKKQHRQLIAETLAVLRDPPPRARGVPLAETAQLLQVVSWDALADDDSVVREGHKFLARHPLSDSVPQVQLLIDQAIEHKQRRLSGARRAADRIAKLKTADRGDPCRRAEIFEDEEQLGEARSAWQDCVKRGEKPPTRLVHLLLVDLRLADYSAASKILKRLEKTAPAEYKAVLPLAKGLPGE